MNIQPKQTGPLILSGRDVTAVLGPTNTGKTHLAIERMVAHESGVIGLPLRLLAREVYQRVCEKVGAAKVALVTGEEKIQPAGAKYFVCTVEATPRETDAAFVALDEVQLAGDFECGHIFTDRILHLRGRQETLLLGAATMQGILQKLLKGISVVTRPRLSHLAYAGSKKLTRLPRRSAIVAMLVRAMARKSHTIATDCPWKFPPLNISPSSKTSGLSVAAFSSRPTIPSAKPRASRTGPCTCGMQRSA